MANLRDYFAAEWTGEFCQVKSSYVGLSQPGVDAFEVKTVAAWEQDGGGSKGLETDTAPCLLFLFWCFGLRS